MGSAPSFRLDPPKQHVPEQEVFFANTISIGVSALRRFEQGSASALCLMEDPRLRADLSVVPRKLQYDKALLQLTMCRGARNCHLASQPSRSKGACFAENDPEVL